MPSRSLKPQAFLAGSPTTFLTGEVATPAIGSPPGPWRSGRLRPSPLFRVTLTTLGFRTLERVRSFEQLGLDRLR